MSGRYFIFPASKTTTDTGVVTRSSPATLHENGTERRWEFETTDAAKEAADLYFDVTEWTTDDLGTLWSK